MKTDYNEYPPRTGTDIEVIEQFDGGRRSFIIGSSASGRYILLRENEYRVFGLLDASCTLEEICREFEKRYGGTLRLETLVKFLARLDQYGILAGQRSRERDAGALKGNQSYLRFKIFNPDTLFESIVRRLRWIWTTTFFAVSILSMAALLLIALINIEEVTDYGVYILREHYVAVLLAGLLIGVTHEFAHGLTCKAFGGRATEVGVLMIYYLLPALYCNVTGIHSIPKRGRRLWVIAAGVYWQLIVGTISLLCWFLLAPHTLLSDLAFIIFLGSVLDVFFEGNPLIKLDGYYLLSQWLRTPNLMDRSRAYWRGALRRILFGDRSLGAAQWTGRERAIYFTYGLLSFLYTVALIFLIVWYAGDYLTDHFYLFGLLLTLGIGLMFVRKPLKSILSSFINMMSGLFNGRQREGEMADDNKKTDEKSRKFLSRRRLAPLVTGLLIAAFLLMPWSASVGNYGTLIAIPEQETIIRAPESASLVSLSVRPGDQVAGSAVIGQMGNLDLEEQILDVQTELARAKTDYDRLVGEMQTRHEAANRAETQLRQRRHDYDEIDSERRQIVEYQRGDVAGPESFEVTKVSSRQGYTRSVGYPAALAMLQSDVDSCRAQLAEASAQRERARRLFTDGIVPRSELDTFEMRASTLSSSCAAARQKLEAALIEHRRKYTSTATDVDLAQSDLSSERLQIGKLDNELMAMRELIGSLEARRDLLGRKNAQFKLVSPRGGAIFGEDLPKMVGRYFEKGAEICRIADTTKLLLRVNVPEREIGDVRVGHGVRLKARSFPDTVFHGVVTKIGGESEQDQNGQATYRVELTIDNEEGQLRPGMTGFARIYFDRQMIGRIILHKIKQALRPELWML